MALKNMRPFKRPVPLFVEVNGLINKGSISTDVEEFFLGVDMKFTLKMIMGLKSATADYACLWCKIHKGYRWDTSKPCNHYIMKIPKGGLWKKLNDCVTVKFTFLLPMQSRMNYTLTKMGPILCLFFFSLFYILFFSYQFSIFFTIFGD